MLLFIRIIILLFSFQNTFALTQVEINKIQTVLDQQVEQKKTIGISVGLIDGEQKIILYSGYRDLNNKVLLNGTEYFAIGSSGKTLTSLLLAVAVVQNKVNIDDKINSYISELEGHKVGELSLRQLSSHSSGLQKDPAELYLHSKYSPFEKMSKEQLIKEAINAEIKLTPGKVKYSNLGVALIGLSLESVFAMSFQEALVTQVFEPLKISDMKVKVSDEDLSLMSKKYTTDFKEIPAWQDLGYFSAAGSIKSDTKTMLNYLYAQLYPENTSISEAILLSQTTLKEYPKFNLKYAWFQFDKSYGKVFWHNGATLGFRTEAFYMPEKKKALVIFNNAGANIECVHQIFLKGEDCEVKKVVLEEDHILNTFTGDFVDKNNTIRFMVRSTEHGFLTLQVLGQQSSVRLYKEQQQNFYSFLGKTGHVRFLKNESGEVIGLNLLQNGSLIEATVIIE
ncbi:MAG: beta-lactamase family protein [Bdellovibrionaceae bacterium]|jgi:serine-type D-Ala-D-Ala carboxypeptidase/endopeptidase|nr:beta-lactamase family protein [Pseudobdellovibrionaceae bacterium]